MSTQKAESAFTIAPPFHMGAEPTMSGQTVYGVPQPLPVLTLHQDFPLERICERPRFFSKQLPWRKPSNRLAFAAFVSEPLHDGPEQVPVLSISRFLLPLWLHAETVARVLTFRLRLI